MRQRHLYLLLFSLPALIAALLAGFVVLAGAAGAMWLFVYGDDPWPGAAEAALVVLFAAVSLAAWAVLLRRAYRAGEEHEQAGAPPKAGRVAIAAAGITALLLVLVGLHQWNVGNIGPKPDSVVCSDFCASRGFAGSSMPPRDAGTPTCTCADAGGRDALTVPLHEAR
jgi:formate hydrogenlyase subunit 3/multisubunit Na+/H+ antiporter MnhD subunit